MLYVEIVYSAKVLNTRRIIGYNVELQKVEIAFIYNFVNQAKYLKCNLCLVNPIQYIVQITKGFIIISLILYYKNKVNDCLYIVECSQFFTRQQWCNNRYQLSYNCLLFNAYPLLNLTKIVESFKASKQRDILKAPIQLRSP